MSRNISRSVYQDIPLRSVTVQGGLTAFVDIVCRGIHMRLLNHQQHIILPLEGKSGKPKQTYDQLAQQVDHHLR